MSENRSRLGIIITLFLGAVFPITGSVIIQLFLPKLFWVQEAFHSTMEAVGALAALVLALIIWLIMRHRKDLAYYTWVSSALVGMGILDGFHASVVFNVSFVWLRSVATLVGGFLFAMVWLPDYITQSRLAKQSPKIVIAVTGILGILSVVFSNELPTMVSQGVFTPTARAINVFGGLFFLAATVYFLIRYRSSRGFDELLFANFCLLLGSASLLFQFSELWEANWWFWHIVRLTAYFIALSFVFSSFQREEEEIRRLNEDLEARITERRRAKDLSDALNDINAAVSSTLEFDEIMKRVVVEATKAIGSEAGVILLRVGERWVARYSYGFQREMAGTPFSDDEVRHAALAVKTRESIIVNDTSIDERVNPAVMKKYGVRSLLAVPLIVREDAIGILCFCYHTRPFAFTETEIDFANKLAASTSLSLQNARLYQIERNIADTLQEALLTIPQKVAGVDFGSLYRSATETTRIGGDFYDLFELERDKVGIVIGDVSGKGLEAATLTALVKNTIEAYAHEGYPPSKVMARTNDVVRRASPLSSFITVFFGILDTPTGRLVYCSAGHPPALIKRRAFEIELLATNSPFIGAFARLSYTDDEVTLEKGDTLILYTDGTIEARCNGQFFGEEGLIGSLKEVRSIPTKDLPQEIFNMIMSCTHGRLTDDIALLTVSLDTESVK